MILTTSSVHSSFRSSQRSSTSVPGWHRPPVWFHGDFHTGNLLTANGHLSAVIDFGELGLGDPACDLTIAFTLMDLEQSIYNAVEDNGEIVQYSVYLSYTDSNEGSAPKWIMMEADGNKDLRLRADFENPDHAAQQIRRRQGIE